MLVIFLCVSKVYVFADIRLLIYDEIISTCCFLMLGKVHW